MLPARPRPPRLRRSVVGIFLTFNVWSGSFAGMRFILFILWRLALGLFTFVVLMFGLCVACTVNESSWAAIPLTVAAVVVPLWIVLRPPTLGRANRPEPPPEELLRRFYG